jgi:hypothetical protein
MSLEVGIVGLPGQAPLVGAGWRAFGLCPGARLDSRAAQAAPKLTL